MSERGEQMRAGLSEAGALGAFGGAVYADDEVRECADCGEFFLIHSEDAEDGREDGREFWRCAGCAWEEED